MKTNALASIAIALVAALCVFSCKKAEDNPTPNVQTTVQTNVASGTWKITKFVDSGDDETSNFSGYAFTFNASGVLNASNGANSYDGTWKITDSNSNDDSQDDLHFSIQFNQSNAFGDLTDDWDFIGQSATKIELIDVSGGNGGTDYLTFEKN